MKIILRRAVSLLLAIMMVFSIFTVMPLTASAGETTSTETSTETGTGTSTETSTETGTETSADTGGVTAKALYKSHIIEWTSDTQETFTVTSSANSNITATITNVQADSKYYYTALVNVGTNVKGGTVYTVTNTTDSTELGRATVTDTTGKESLIKNSLVTKDYRNETNGYKTFDSSTAVENLQIGNDVIAKLKELNSGTVVVSATSTSTSTPQAIISLSNTLTDSGSNATGIYVGVRNSSYNVGFRFNGTWAGTFTAYSLNKEKYTAAISITEGVGLRTAGNGANSFTSWDADERANMFKPFANCITGAYIGGMGNGSTAKFTGKVYYALITQEIYTNDELADITASDDSMGTAITNNMFNGNSGNTWVFVGGRDVEGPYTDVFGYKNYVSSFEEYIRSVLNIGSGDGTNSLTGNPNRERYVINGGKTDNTLAKILENYDRLVVENDPKAISYIVGKEDYQTADDATIETFKTNLTDLINRGLALRENTGYVVIQTPYVPFDTTLYNNAKVYADAVNEVVSSLTVQQKRKIAVVDHFTLTDNDTFRTTCFNADGTLNGAGHLTISKQMQTKVAGSCANWNITTLSMEGVTNHNTTATVTSTMSGKNLTINVSEVTGITQWTYYVEVDGSYTVSKVAGNTAIFKNLPVNKDYKLTIISADGRTQLTVMAGKTVDGNVATKAVKFASLTEQQQAIHDKLASKDSVIWLLMGDSITHGIGMDGHRDYDNLNGLFTKFIREELGRRDDMVVNAAVSSATTTSTVARINERLNRYSPDIVIVQLGTNDATLTNLIPVDNYKANLQTIIDAIVKKGAIPILRAPTARLDTSNTGGVAQPKYVQACKEIAEANDVLFINQFEITTEHISRNTYLRNSGQNGYLFLSDTVHFTANGQVAMIRMLLDGIGFETYNSNIYNNYYSVPHTDATNDGIPTVSESQGSITLNLEDISKVYSNPVSYVTLSATNGDFTYTAKVNNTKSQVSINDLPNGDYTVKVAVNLTNESKTVTFATQTVNISDSFAGDSVTAKALYKSHKIEWSSTGKEDVSVFTISNSAGAVSVTPTYVDVEGTRYYTAIISIATGTAGGETYTVLNTTDNTIIGRDTVVDATGFEALAKNAVATFDYRATGGKIFDGTSKDQLIEISGGDPVKAAKLKALTNGSVLVGYERANTNATLFFGSDDGSYSVGVNSDKMFAVNKKSGTSGWAYLTAPSANTYSTYGVTSCGGGFWTANSNGIGNYTTSMGTFLNASTSSKFYLGGQNTDTPKLFNGVIYYAIVSEESYASTYTGSGKAEISYANELKTLVTTTVSLEVADVTAKALYKSHKIEWSSTTSSDTADFSIYKNDSTTAETNITYLTTISRGDRHYFTALVEVGANVSAGVKYTVTKGETSISATVADNTGREALIKNAIVSKDYRTVDGTGYKTIASADDVEKLDVSKVTLEKLKTLTTGAMVLSASRTGDISTDTAAMSLGASASNAPFIGVRKSVNSYGFKFNSKWAGGGMGANVTDTQSVMAASIIYGTGCYVYSNGSNSYSSWQTDTDTTFIETTGKTPSSYKDNVTGVYIGGTSGKTNLFTNGNIYFAVISEEKLTGDDLAVITKVDLTNVKGVSTGLTHTISWSGTTNTGWTIKGNGTDITSKATITHTDGVVTAVIPVSSTSDIEYVIENNTQIGTVLVKYVPVPNDFTAKALYKSHKLEWTSDREADYIVYSNGNKVEGTLSMVTDSDGKRYYTFIVSGITTGTGKGTEYELYVDPTNSITAKVEEKTGLEALIKNALVAKDYRGTEEGHKTFGDGVNAENLNVSAATLAKIKSLNSGSIIISAKTTDQSAATQPVIALSNSVNNDSGVYVGVRKTANQFGFRLNSKWTATFNCYLYNDGIHSFAVSATEGAGVRTAGDGANSYNNWNGSSEGSLFVPSAGDITGVSIGGPVGENVASTFKGDVYYAIISEEIYTNEELADITQTNYNRLLSLISSTKTTLDSVNYKNDGNYRELQDAINLYSTYTSATDVATLNNAITQINTLSESLTVREATLTDEAISDETLKASADDNSHAGSGNDGSAVNMFDGNTATLWHTSYNNTHGSTLYTDTFNVDANHPVWMQTGFGKTEYITRIVCTPRTDANSGYKHQIKDYAVYVSNSDTKPVAVANVTETNDWTLVQSGTLTAVNASSTERNQVITFSQPVQAKWIRLVVTSTSSAEFLCIAEMDIYKIPDSTSQTSDIANQIMDKLAEAKEMLNNANVVKDTAYEEYTAAIAELDKGDLTTEATQAKLEEITTKVAALSFTTTTADGETATYTAAAQQTMNSIDEKIEEAKRVTMQSGVDTETLNAKITELEALTVTESADVLTTKLAELETQISTAKTEKKTPNKSETFDGDSVKWNNTTDRVATLANNASANVEKATGAVRYIFDGDYSLNVVATNFYGSWRDAAAERMAPWIATGFGETVCVSGIVIFDRVSSAGGTVSQNCFKNYEVWVSNDANFDNYVVAATGTRTDTVYSENGYAIKFDQPYDCQYIKFVTHGSVDCKIVEMDIYEYVGSATPVKIKVTSTDGSVEIDTVLETINFNQKFTDKFGFDELQSQVFDIKLSDIAHDYVITVNADTTISVAASNTNYKLTISQNGTSEVVQSKNYGQNFDYRVTGAIGWMIDGNVVCDGSTFNYKATDNITATPVFEEITKTVSAYIPEPVISYNGTKTTIQIPVYINGTTDYTDKGIIFVKTGTDVEVIKSAVLGTANNYVKVFSAGDNNDLTLTNKGRYLHTLKVNGRLPAGEFYAYVVTVDADTGASIVTLSNKQIKE